MADTNTDGITGGVGDEITYTFTVTNTGLVTLTGVTITDPLVTIVGGPLASLAPGGVDSTTFTATYTITQTDIDNGSITNTATASASDPNNNPVTDLSDDPNEPANVDTEADGEPDDPTIVPLTQTATIELTKTAGALADTNTDGITGGLGDDITYTFTVTNTGNTTLTDITITDPLVTITGGPIATLTPGDSDSTTFTATYTITQTDIDNGSITNTATANALDPNNNPCHRPLGRPQRQHRHRHRSRRRTRRPHGCPPHPNRVDPARQDRRRTHRHQHRRCRGRPG